MTKTRHYHSQHYKTTVVFNWWDLLSLIIILGFIVALAWGATQMVTPYHIGEPLKISLAPSQLPSYAIRTVSRMFIALFFSFLFTFTIGTWAAKSKRAEQIIIPLIDILQSVPVLSFLSITIVGFITLFPNSLLGPECASIFAIFTAQAWNMTLGFYQTLRSVPHDLIEAADSFHLSGWQRFWRIEVPFSMSGLLWNTMMSMSASWFFVVFSEAIAVSNQNIRLPGIGSYIKLAIDNANIHAVFYAIITMLIVIFLYDQLLFRPLIVWSEKFKVDHNYDEQPPRSWVMTLWQRTRFLRYHSKLFARFADSFINLSLFRRSRSLQKTSSSPSTKKSRSWLWRASISIVLLITSYLLLHFITATIAPEEIIHVSFLGLFTSVRVISLIIISSLVWVPIGVLIGLRPRLSQTIQPIIQFLASFPANLLYPLIVIFIVRYQLNVEIWVTPLMIIGTQWYILFNVIAGSQAIPKDLCYVANNFNVKGWQWWRQLALPGVFPYYITGAITAAGGAWNASIVAEWVNWGNTNLHATGLGAYIQAQTVAGDFPRIALGTAMMCIYVLAFNRLLWRPLYRLAEKRYRLE